LRYRRSLLPDRDVDALHALTALIDDRVDRDCGLAGLAVADDQFALSAADTEHRVDRLDPGLHRFFDRGACDDPRRFDLDSARLGGLDRSLVVDRLAKRVDDAPEQRVAYRYF